MNDDFSIGEKAIGLQYVCSRTSKHNCKGNNCILNGLRKTGEEAVIRDCHFKSEQYPSSLIEYGFEIVKKSKYFDEIKKIIIEMRECIKEQSSKHYSGYTSYPMFVRRGLENNYDEFGFG